MKWVSEGGAWRSGFFSDPSCQSLWLWKSVSKHLIYYFSVYLHPPETRKSLLAPPSSSVHIRCLQGEIGIGFSQNRLGRATFLSSVLKGSRRGLGNEENFQQFLPIGVEPSWWLVLALKLHKSIRDPECEKAVQNGWVYRSSRKVTPWLLQVLLHPQKL